MNLKNFLKIFIILILSLFLLSVNHVVYADDFGADDESGEYTDEWVDNGGGHTIVVPTPTPNIDDEKKPLTNTHYVYQTNTLEGRIVETVEAKDNQEIGGVTDGRIKDSSSNIYKRGIPNLKVELYIDGKKYGETTTGSLGTYSFNVLGMQGKHKYYIKYSYPNVTQQEIDNIKSVEDAKKVQEKIIYNGQDYQTISGEKKSTIEINGKGIAQVFILLDCSISMEKSYVTLGTGERITKLELEKRIAEKLVKDLLADDKNIVIGLIVYRGQNYRKVSLTDNQEKLLNAIRSDMQFTETGYTNIVGALDKAYNSFANNDKENSNRYIFLLSDGLPTSDGARIGKNRVYKVEGDNEKRTKIIEHNSIALKNIAENTAKKIVEIEDEGITIFSAISTENMTQAGMKRLEEIYKENKNSKYNKYLAVNSIEEIIGSKFFKDLKLYVKDSVKVIDTGYKIDEANRGENIKNNYNHFKNDNTIYFEALDMNIQSTEDIQLFKEYAKEILEKTYSEVVTPTSTAEFKYEQLPAVTNIIHYKKDAEGNDTSEVDYYEEWVLKQISFVAPDSCLEKLPAFTITPRITITDAKIINTIGNVIKERQTSTNSVDTRNQPLYIEIEHEQLYGSKIDLEYTIEIVNKSIFNNAINDVGMYLYIPDKFVFDKSLGIKAVIMGSGSTQELNINAREFDIAGVEYHKKNGLLPNNFGKIEKYIKDGHQAIFLNIQNPKKLKIPTNAKIQIQLHISKLLSGDEYDEPYDGNVELITYSNMAYRRLQYNTKLVSSTSINTGYDGAVAGNMDQDEKDFAESNKVVTLTPTGEDKSLGKIYITVIVLIITIMIILIKKRKCN